MPGKGKKKVSKKKRSAKTDDYDDANSKDPLRPEYFVPPPKPGEKLINLLTRHEVEEKELFGFRVSTRSLEKLTPQEIKDLRIVFQAFDINNKGHIGPIEVRKAMRCLGFKIKKEDVKRFITDASVKGKGYVDFNEFLDIIIEQQGDARDIYDEIYQGFNMFDCEKKGRVSAEDLKKACMETGVKLTKQEIEEMIIEADQNGDGVIDREEFTKMMLQTNLF